MDRALEPAGLPRPLRLLRWYGQRFPIQRGKRKLVEAVFRRRERIEAPLLASMPAGVVMEFWPWLWSDFSMMMMGGPERDCSLYLERRLTEEMVLVEIGAYLAESAFLVATRARGSSTHVFEPHPESARRIADAIARSRLANVHLNRIALGERAGRSTFRLEDYPASSRLDSAGEGPVRQLEVAVTTLDDYCREARIERLDLLKIDVEGAELPVLRGGRETIHRFRPEMIIELHGPESPAFGYELRQLIDYLESELGYRLLRLKPGLTGPRLGRFRYSPALDRKRRNIVARPRKTSRFTGGGRRSAF